MKVGCIYVHNYIRIANALHLLIVCTYVRTYVDSCDDNVTLIGAVVGAFCVIIIIMVITNNMVWIYCFRKRQHTGSYSYVRI